jgi:argininosuccinate lyase
MNLWGGRFTKEENAAMKAFNASLPMGKRYYREDIAGSLAHVQMLGECGVISAGEADAIRQGLRDILGDLESGRLVIEEDEFEDIHSFVEITLTERIGPVGKKLHTARSRNDQVAVDTKLYAKRVGADVIAALDRLCATLRRKAEENPVIMPGYTHLQRAQVVTFPHYMMAYREMFLRDGRRIRNALEIADECPLGCGALAGTTHPIDRARTAELLGFAKPVENFLDGVADRDYLIELLAAFSLIMMHLSRLSEELILWCSREFRFISMDDSFATGSSMMPQKKNPDAAELVRGDSGLVYGALMALLTTMKGIPLAYDKDMQLDKKAFMPALDVTLDCLGIMDGMIATMTVNGDEMRRAVKDGFLNATELADYLVRKGVPFRDAHAVVGAIVLHCEREGCAIEDLSPAVLKGFSDAIGPDLYACLDYDAILDQGIKSEMKRIGGGGD